MKLKITRALAAILAAAMLLTGCGSGSSDSSEALSSADTSSVSDAGSAVDSSKSAEESTVDSSSETADDTSDAASAADSEADSKSEDEKSEGITPLMWEVVSEDGSKVTFIGSMHALKDDAYPLPEALEDAYKSCDILAVECDITDVSSDLAGQLSQLDKMFYTDFSLTRDHMNAEIYDNVIAFAEKCGGDLSLYQYCKPWVYVALVENLAIECTDLDASKGLDAHLLERAHKDSKEIYEVESAEFQMDMFMDLSDELCEALLEGYSAENYDQIIQNLEDTYTAWCKGDKEAFEREADIDASIKAAEDAGMPMTEREIEMLREYNKILLDDRNEGMVKKAVELIEGGKNVLYVVGAAHFAGEKGIIKLLEKEGYTVTQIMP